MRVRELGTRSASALIREIASQMVRGRAPSVHVERRQIPYWRQRGWVRQGNSYRGNYQTGFAAFMGSVTEHAGPHFDFFLYRPSAQIRNHSHWTCFVDRGGGWYQVHMSRQPTDVGSGILAIEHLISEAYE